MASASRTSVFVSYSHADSRWLERLRVHLKPLVRDAGLSLWADTNIKPGQDWKAEIAEALKSAKVAVLLVTADFLASDFIATQELPPLLAAAQKDGAVVLPMLIKPSRFQQTKGLSDFQAVNAPSDPVSGMSETAQEQAFVTLADRIVEVLQEDSKPSQAADEELQAEEVSKAGAQVFHPGNRLSTRAALQPCTFFVSPFYPKTKLWNLYGDIQVELLHDSSGEKAFLIPSGATPPHLRDTGYLRTAEGASIVEQKRAAAESFVRQWRNQELQGFRFCMSTKSGEQRTKLYCAAYDKCLVDHVGSSKGS